MSATHSAGSRFSSDHNRMTYGVVLGFGDHVHLRKTKPGLIWDKEAPAGARGQQNLRGTWFLSLCSVIYPWSSELPPTKPPTHPLSINLYKMIPTQGKTRTSGLKVAGTIVDAGRKQNWWLREKLQSHPMLSQKNSHMSQLTEERITLSFHQPMT